MRPIRRSLVSVAAAGALALGVVAVTGTAGMTASGSHPDARVLGLDSNGTGLSVFRLRSASKTKSIGSVKGLEGDTRLVGIDFRIQDGRFYGVGDEGGIYRIDSGNGKATKKSQLSVELQGTSFGVDFNPAADRLRVVSDTGQNLRHDINQPAPPTVVDGQLGATGIVGAAYTNNDVDASTGTFLYDLDAQLDRIVTQVPPNDGVLVPNGPTRYSATPEAGFDIQTVRTAGVASDNIAYAVMRISAGSRPNLFRVDLQSGKATRLAKLNRSVADLAIQQ